LTAEPTEGAFTNEIVEAAWAMLGDSGLDLFGEGYAPIEVTLNEGGA
jgi:NitT/TauT family transport system substrate-binding protein